jgi:hypothetical protein
LNAPPPPLQERGGLFSYEDVLIAPAAAALRNTLPANMSVEFSLAGEQGLSVFGYPSNWAAAMGRARQRLADVGTGRHTFGVCFNWCAAGAGRRGGRSCVRRALGWRLRGAGAPLGSAAAVRVGAGAEPRGCG